MNRPPKVRQNTFGGYFMSKHTFEKKLSIVSRVRNGTPISHLSREYGIHERMILEWVRKHDRFGDQGLQKRPNIRANGDFKVAAVRLVIENKLSLREVVLQYGVSMTTLERWVRAFRKDGYQVLHVQNKQRRPVKDMSRAKKQEPKTELEKLQSENARLRAENALLKKVKALVEEREAHECTTGRKPSKD